MNTRYETYYSLCFYYRIEYMMGQLGHQQSLFSYTIKCKADVGNNTFVVQKEMQGYQTQYACLQFVPRDVNVVQWKFSSWEHYQGNVSCHVMLLHPGI